MWYINELQPVVGNVSVVLVKKQKEEIVEQQSLSIAYYGKCSLDSPPDEKTPYSAVFIDSASGTLMPVADCLDEGWEVVDWIIS